MNQPATKKKTKPLASPAKENKPSTAQKSQKKPSLKETSDVIKKQENTNESLINLVTLESSAALEANLIQQQTPEYVKLLEEYTEKVTETSKLINSLTDRIRGGEFATSHGISFLDVKYHLLASYCYNLVYVMLLKTNGSSLKDHPVVNQLVKIRTILEKVQPLDSKLKYQIDKLLNAANSNADDPMKFKPNPSGLINKTEEMEDEGKGDVYQPPKLAEVVVDSKQNRYLEDEKLRKRLARSKIVQSLREEFSDRPLEIREFAGHEEGDSDEAERTRYEEENFTRLVVAKKDRKKKKKRSHGLDAAGVDDFDFRDLALLDEKRRDDEEFLAKKQKAYDEFMVEEKRVQKKNMRKMRDMRDMREMRGSGRFGGRRSSAPDEDGVGGMSRDSGDFESKKRKFGGKKRK